MTDIVFACMLVEVGYYDQLLKSLPDLIIQLAMMSALDVALIVNYCLLQKEIISMIISD